MIQYCKSCILPNTRPNVVFNQDGHCNASTFESKESIDWIQRERDFVKIIKDAKLKTNNYDCIIPVSGGKDSTWQVIKALEYGLRPLCVTWKTPFRTELGKSNLENLVSLGVNHLDFTINPKVEKIFTYKSFERFGSPVIPMHMALHAIPLQIAVNFKIPLIIWGENSAYEYGGNEKYMGFMLDREWLKKYGVTNGTTSEDWIDDDLSKKDLQGYEWPSDLHQKETNVKAIFMGHFFNWDPHETYKISKSNGFKAADKPKTGLYKFADIDDSFLITIHHWMKWYKFGFTRLWDNLSIEVRSNRLSREEAIQVISETGDEEPRKEIDSFCEYLQISKGHFHEITEKFRNKKIWKKNKDDIWIIENFLIKNWKW